MRRAGSLVALGMIVVANAVVLLEVAHNRSGGPMETIRLTERELPLNPRENENSEMSVRLNWRRPSPVLDDYSWLDRTKLEGLGFDYTRAMRDPLHPALPRPAFLVLEFNGAAWEKWLQSAPQPVNQPEMFSRLVPVDAASTPELLLRKYSDRGKYLIVRGIIQLQPQLRPFVWQIVPESIHIPPPLSDALVRFAGASDMKNPRYTLTLSYGRNFEPWLVSE